MDKIIKLDREITNEMGRLATLLDRDGYPYKAGYLESFVGSLAVELNLNQKQMRTFANLLKSRGDRQLAKAGAK